MNYSDLLTVPFKKRGRGCDGMDCYGLVMECVKRDGKGLRDCLPVLFGDINEYEDKINVREIEKPVSGCVAQFYIDRALHVGYMLDKRTVLHMTRNCARVSPVETLGNVRYYEVIND